MVADGVARWLSTGAGSAAGSGSLRPTGGTDLCLSGVAVGNVVDMLGLDSVARRGGAGAIVRLTCHSFVTVGAHSCQIAYFGGSPAPSPLVSLFRHRTSKEQKCHQTTMNGPIRQRSTLSL